MSATRWKSVLSLPVSPERDHIRGPIDAPVTLLEYGDYECPYCRAAHSVVNAVQAQMGSRLRFVFRHFPLTTMHPHAEQAAEAAEAAGRQRKFWPMHDVLYTHQDSLDYADLLAHATGLGLDLDRFERELAGHLHAEKVHEDLLSGVRSGVNGTPAFYVNGIRHDGSWDFPDLLAVAEGSLARLGAAG